MEQMARCGANNDRLHICGEIKLRSCFDEKNIIHNNNITHIRIHHAVGGDTSGIHTKGSDIKNQQSRIRPQINELLICTDKAPLASERQDGLGGKDDIFPA